MKCSEILKEHSSPAPSFLMVSRPATWKPGILHHGVVRPPRLHSQACEKAAPPHSQFISPSSRILEYLLLIINTAFVCVGRSHMFAEWDKGDIKHPSGTSGTKSLFIDCGHGLKDVSILQNISRWSFTCVHVTSGQLDPQSNW